MSTNESPYNRAEETGDALPQSDVLDYLDPEDPADAEILNNLDRIRDEIREKYPTPMSIVDVYRKGFVDYAYIAGGFSENELAEILNEAKRRNEEEKGGAS